MTMHTRIFRSPVARYYDEDILEGPSVYTEASLATLAGHGFNGIWLRGRLRDLMQSTALPELNDAQRQERLDSLRARFATLTGVDRPASDGDFVTLDLSATLDGVEAETRALLHGRIFNGGHGHLADGLLD